MQTWRPWRPIFDFLKGGLNTRHGALYWTTRVHESEMSLPLRLSEVQPGARSHVRDATVSASALGLSARLAGVKGPSAVTLQRIVDHLQYGVHTYHPQQMSIPRSRNDSRSQRIVDVDRAIRTRNQRGLRSSGASQVCCDWSLP